MQCTHLEREGEGTPPSSGPAVLTRRQQEILLHCVAEGYYEIPRRSTLRALAKHLGISPTTLSLVLRRAERTVVKQFTRTRQAEAIPAMESDAGKT